MSQSFHCHLRQGIVFLLIVKDMKVFSSFLVGFALLLFGTNALFAGPSCNPYDSAQHCSPGNTKSSMRTREEKAQIRSLRRQHTREAYKQDKMTDTSLSADDCQRYHKGKRMTADERMRLRQQIDEAGQAIYHR